MDISTELQTLTDPSMPRKRAFPPCLDDEEHSTPKKLKRDISSAHDPIYRSSPLKRKFTTGIALESQEEDNRHTPRATKRQRKPSNESSSKRAIGDPSSSRTADWTESQSIRESRRFPDDRGDPLIEHKNHPQTIENGSLRLTKANLRRIPSGDSTPSEMSQSFVSTQSDRSSVVKPTDSEYETLLKERGIYSLSRKAPEPNNLVEVKHALASRRESPGPSDVTAENFPRRVRKSGNEGSAMQGLLPKVLPIIERFWDSEHDALPLNQQWDRQTLLNPELRPSISPPKPDQAFGFTPDAFPFPQAALFLKPSMSPARDLAWPYFTVETKGRQGHLDVARLQNSHNAAVMLNNMLQLKQSLNKEHEIFGSIRVMTMELTTESISLCGHMIVRSASGILEFYSLCLSCYSAADPTGRAYKEAYRDAMNAVELIREKSLKWITADMARLEERLVSSMQQGLSQITPPGSDFEYRDLTRPRAGARTRGNSRTGSRVNSRSQSLSRKVSTLSNELDP